MILKVYDVLQTQPPYNRRTMALCKQCARELGRKPGLNTVRLYEVLQQFGTCDHCEKE